jgi:hypothetical protein
MKYIKATLILFCFITLVNAGCNKEEDPVKKGSELISFTELQAGSDTLIIGETTNITAIYEGSGVSFEWEVTSGNLTGGGAQVQYHVAICDVGRNTITCTAKAENTTITRDIQILVKVQ